MAENEASLRLSSPISPRPIGAHAPPPSPMDDPSFSSSSSSKNPSWVEDLRSAWSEEVQKMEPTKQGYFRALLDRAFEEDRKEHRQQNSSAVHHPPRNRRSESQSSPRSVVSTSSDDSSSQSSEAQRRIEVGSNSSSSSSGGPKRRVDEQSESSQQTPPTTPSPRHPTSASASPRPALSKTGSLKTRFFDRFFSGGRKKNDLRAMLSEYREKLKLTLLECKQVLQELRGNETRLEMEIRQELQTLSKYALRQLIPIFRSLSQVKTIRVQKRIDLEARCKQVIKDRLRITDQVLSTAEGEEIPSFVDDSFFTEVEDLLAAHPDLSRQWKLIRSLDAKAQHYATTYLHLRQEARPLAQSDKCILIRSIFDDIEEPHDARRGLIDCLIDEQETAVYRIFADQRNEEGRTLKSFFDELNQVGIQNVPCEEIVSFIDHYVKYLSDAYNMPPCHQQKLKIIAHRIVYGDLFSLLFKIELKDNDSKDEIFRAQQALLRDKPWQNLGVNRKFFPLKPDQYSPDPYSSAIEILNFVGLVTNPLDMLFCIVRASSEIFHVAQMQRRHHHFYSSSSSTSASIPIPSAASLAANASKTRFRTLNPSIFDLMTPAPVNHSPSPPLSSSPLATKLNFQSSSPLSSPSSKRSISGLHAAILSSHPDLQRQPQQQDEDGENQQPEFSIAQSSITPPMDMPAAATAPPIVMHGDEQISGSLEERMARALTTPLSLSPNSGSALAQLIAATTPRTITSSVTPSTPSAAAAIATKEQIISSASLMSPPMLPLPLPSLSASATRGPVPPSDAPYQPRSRRSSSAVAPSSSASVAPAAPVPFSDDGSFADQIMISSSMMRPSQIAAMSAVPSPLKQQPLKPRSSQSLFGDSPSSSSSIAASAAAGIDGDASASTPPSEASIMRKNSNAALISAENIEQVSAIASGRVAPQSPAGNNQLMEEFGADEFIPLFVYVVARADLPNAHAIISFLQKYTPGTERNSESFYYFTCLEGAVLYITQQQQEKEEKEQKEKEKAEEEELTKKPSPLDPMDPVEDAANSPLPSPTARSSSSSSVVSGEAVFSPSSGPEESVVLGNEELLSP